MVVEAGERARRVKLTRKGFLVLQKLRNLRDLLEDLGIEV